MWYPLGFPVLYIVVCTLLALKSYWNGWVDFSSDLVRDSCCICRQLEDSCACGFPLIPARLTWKACLRFSCFKCTMSTPKTCTSNLRRRRCTDSLVKKKKTNQANPVKPMLVLRQHFLYHFPPWGSSHNNYSLESWASFLLLHMFIKHWCCVLVVLYCAVVLLLVQQ